MPVTTARSDRISSVRVESIAATPLYKAYLRHDPAIHKFYPHHPFSRHFPDAGKTYSDERRRQVASVLEEQNRRWGAGDRTLRNLERFRVGAAAVVTGQQVGLFGGPLYSILKAVTAIKQAAEQTSKGTETVPIFWLATEDHDLDEVRFTEVLTPQHEILRLQIDSKNQGLRVGDVELTEEISRSVVELKGVFGDSDVIALVERCYAPGETLASSFAKLFTVLFRDFGLILIDNRDPRLHTLIAPIFMKAAAHAVPLNQALRRRNQELESGGYHAQVHVEDSSTLLFHQQAGKRIAVRMEGELFEAGKRRWTAEELAKEAERSPQDFSANALLRPVIQDCLLPTAAYIGGPAEIAYFAQSEVLYRELLGRVTPVVPRASVTMIEPGIARLLEKYRLTPQEVFLSFEDLRQAIAKSHLPSEIQSMFRTTANVVDEEMRELESGLPRLDPTLVDAAKKAGEKVRYQVRRLEARAARAFWRREADMDRQLHRLSNSLFPKGTLQERELAGMYFLAKQGLPLLDLLQNSIPVDTAEHYFLWL